MGLDVGKANITNLFRNGSSNVVLDMDDLNYHYYSGTNKLKYVEDPVDPNNYNVDIDEQTNDNYIYEEIGNFSGNIAIPAIKNFFIPFRFR